MTTAAPSAVQVGEVTLTQVLDAVGPLGACNDLYPDGGHYPGSGIGRVVHRDGVIEWEEAR